MRRPATRDCPLTGPLSQASVSLSLRRTSGASPSPTPEPKVPHPSPSQAQPRLPAWSSSSSHLEATSSFRFQPVRRDGLCPVPSPTGTSQASPALLNAWRAALGTKKTQAAPHHRAKWCRQKDKWTSEDKETKEVEGGLASLQTCGGITTARPLQGIDVGRGCGSGFTGLWTQVGD